MFADRKSQDAFADTKWDPPHASIQPKYVAWIFDIDVSIDYNVLFTARPNLAKLI